MGDSPLRDVQCQACGRWHPRETACTKGDPPSLLHRVRVALETLPEGSHVSVVFHDAALAQLAAVVAERDRVRIDYVVLKERCGALQDQLALARPIAEACADWVDKTGACRLCDYMQIEGAGRVAIPHAADCPVPAWIAGRK